MSAVLSLLRVASYWAEQDNGKESGTRLEKKMQRTLELINTSQISFKLPDFSSLLHFRLRR